MDSVHFYAKAEQGRLIWQEPGKVSGALSRLNGQRIRITIEKADMLRSLPQNRRYWTIVREVAAFLSEAHGRVITKDQTHEALKAAFLGTEETKLGPVPTSTRTLTVEAFSAYCDRIVAHAASEWGLVLLSEEVA